MRFAVEKTARAINGQLIPQLSAGSTALRFFGSGARPSAQH
jgi:hypothetical protein